MNAWVLAVNCAAAAILLRYAFCTLRRMTWRTNHCQRLVNWVIAVGAAAILLTPFVDAGQRELWLAATTAAVLLAVAVQASIGRRERDRYEPRATDHEQRSHL